MYTMTVTASRHRLPWSMSETNRLYSEYELKQLPISNIAQLHARTEYAILHKLAQEFLINASWNDVKGWKAPKEMTMQPKVSQKKVTYYDDSDYEDSVVSLEDCDDPNDSDYVDEEEAEDDDDSSDYEDEDEDEDEEEEEFDAYSIPQKASSLRKLIDAAKFFIYAA